MNVDLIDSFGSMFFLSFTPLIFHVVMSLAVSSLTWAFSDFISGTLHDIWNYATVCNGNFGTGRPQCQRAWLDGRTLVNSYHKRSWQVQIVNEGYQILIVYFHCYIGESHSESFAIKWISHSEQHFPLGGSGERNTNGHLP